MASLNKVVLIGNLTRNVELKYTQAGMAVGKFGIAINEKFKQGDEWKDKVHFIDITVWGKQAEACSKYLAKGRQACIEGKLNYSSWEAEEVKRNKLDVVADKVVFLGSKDDEGTGAVGKTSPRDFKNKPIDKDEGMDVADEMGEMMGDLDVPF